jgi:hypothetical protein
VCVRSMMFIMSATLSSASGMDDESHETRPRSRTERFLNLAIGTAGPKPGAPPPEFDLGALMEEEDEGNGGFDGITPTTPGDVPLATPQGPQGEVPSTTEAGDDGDEEGQAPITALDDATVEEFAGLTEVEPVIAFLDGMFIKRFEFQETEDSVRNGIAKHLVETFSEGHSDVKSLLEIFGHVLNNEFTVHRYDWGQGIDYFNSSEFRNSTALSLKIFNTFWDAVPSDELQDVILKPMEKFHIILRRWENQSGDATDQQLNKALYQRENWTAAFEYFGNTIDMVTDPLALRLNKRKSSEHWLEHIENERVKKEEQQHATKRGLFMENNEKIEKAFVEAKKAKDLFRAENDLPKDERSPEFKHIVTIRKELSSKLGKIKDRKGQSAVLRMPSIQAIQKEMNTFVRSAAFALADDCANNRLHPFLSGIGRCVGEAVQRNWDILKGQPEIAFAYLSQYTVFSTFAKLNSSHWSRCQKKLLEVIRSARLRPEESATKIAKCPVTGKLYPRQGVHPIVFEEVYNTIKSCSASLVADGGIREALMKLMYCDKQATRSAPKTKAVLRASPIQDVTLCNTVCENAASFQKSHVEMS